MLYGAVLLWWLQISASNNRNWAPEYAWPASVARDSDRITVRNIRNFTYRTEADVSQAYDDATYDLAMLDTKDLVTSYWAGDEIAHVFVSFGFRDGRHLAVSIEMGRERGESYSTLAGFFRHYELIYVVADERDLIGLRTDIRGERVYLYQLRLPPEMVRRLFVSYLDRVAALESRPEFYNTLTNNCTTGVLGRARAVTDSRPQSAGPGKRLCRRGRLPPRPTRSAAALSRVAPSQPHPATSCCHGRSRLLGGDQTPSRLSTDKRKSRWGATVTVST
jgi:hypothetical protein